MEDPYSSNAASQDYAIRSRLPETYPRPRGPRGPFSDPPRSLPLALALGHLTFEPMRGDKMNTSSSYVAKEPLCPLLLGDSDWLSSLNSLVYWPAPRRLRVRPGLRAVSGSRLPWRLISMNTTASRWIVNGIPNKHAAGACKVGVWGWEVGPTQQVSGLRLAGERGLCGAAVSG